MKYKNYIIVLLLVLFLGCNKIYAAESKTCYYITDEANARLEISWGYSASILHGKKGFSKAYFERLGTVMDTDTEGVLNWYKDFTDNRHTYSTGVTLSRIYLDKSEANKSPTCPEYLIMRSNNNNSSYGAYATNDLNTAKNFVDLSRQTGKYQAWYLTYKDENGNEYTEEQYNNSIRNTTLGNTNPNYVVNGTGEDVSVDCNEIFGSKNDPDSISYLVNEILQYPRIIVPILIILLGILDFAKAVVAGKEDEMKKAQSTFVKRVIAGVIFFFIPVIVDIVMQLADIVWEGLGYTSCDI